MKLISKLIFMATGSLLLSACGGAGGINTNMKKMDVVAGVDNQYSKQTSVVNNYTGLNPKALLREEVQLLTKQEMLNTAIVKQMEENSEYRKKNGEMWAGAMVQKLKITPNTYKKDQVLIALWYCDKHHSESKKTCDVLIENRKKIMSLAKIKQKEYEEYMKAE